MNEWMNFYVFHVKYRLLMYFGVWINITRFGRQIWKQISKMAFQESKNYLQRKEGLSTEGEQDSCQCLHFNIFVSSHFAMATWFLCTTVNSIQNAVLCRWLILKKEKLNFHTYHLNLYLASNHIVSKMIFLMTLAVLNFRIKAISRPFRK